MIEIYTAHGCGYCNLAKKWLSNNGHEYVEYKLSTPEDKAAFKDAHPGVTTIPQIFINGEHVGGYSELIQYEI